MKPKFIIAGGAIVVGIAATFFLLRNTRGGAEVEYRYSTVDAGELLLSTTATGVLVPLTTVDVKSKAGGKVVHLAVEEGSIVKTGDLIATIDPSDTQSLFDQANADVLSAQARVSQAQTNASLGSILSGAGLRDAEIQVQLAKIRLAKAEQDNLTQPELTKADLRTAQANLRSAEQALKKLQKVDIPQRQTDAKNGVKRAQTDLEVANLDLERQQKLLAKGYVAKSTVDRARSTAETARSAYETAKQKLETLDSDIDTDLRTQQARVEQAKAALAQSEANKSKVFITQKALEEAKRNLKSVQIALEKAKADQLNVKSKGFDVATANASAVRSKVARDNAKTQLDSTTVLAPRDGIVTTKYLEEGTIIPPGTSTFAQGTSLVQIADTTKMFVECTVDEADIAAVKQNQDVRIIVEAYPGRTMTGKVTKIFPAATTQSGGVTTIKVRVAVGEEDKTAKAVKPKAGGAPGGQGGGAMRPGGGGNPMAMMPPRPTNGKMVLRPGMNATVEFILMRKDSVVRVPMQAIKREQGKTYVQVKSKDPLKPEKREVKVGATGNTDVEILEGLKEGEEVVVAEIDLRAMRDRQDKMDKAQAGGGLGGQAKGGPSKSRGGM